MCKFPTAKVYSSFGFMMVILFSTILKTINVGLSSFSTTSLGIVQIMVFELSPFVIGLLLCKILFRIFPTCRVLLVGVVVPPP